MVQPTGTTSQDSADPIEEPRAPEPPAKRRGGGGWRKWRARFVVLLLLAAAVFLFLRISTARESDAARIDLDTLTLTAQPLPVEVAQTGQVTGVSVTAQERVTAGQKLGTIEVATTDSDGDPKLTRVDVKAPRPGIVVDLPVTVGSSIAPGQPFLELYDPALLRFETHVPLKDLPEIAPSMTASLKAEGISRTVHAQVQRIVPQVGSLEDIDFAHANAANTTSGDTSTDKTDKADQMTLVLVPASAEEVRGLVPGMRFTGYVDTRTGVPGTARLVSMGR
ncbi:HlyD family efflux transporter periplasmic adaptor subunit [Nucisporomicrobium flavum]|uniref:HlyD family efflux transporter periplasmic adaptor subunit n=1 Tax=Nucisporomicrobium flavum TaxID=2785915 RepID=UPI003C2B1004